MANEITVTVALTAAKDYLGFTRRAIYRLSLSIPQYDAKTETLSDDDVTDLPFNSTINDPGYAFFRNLSTNGASIEVGIIEDIVYGGRFYPFAYVKPGEPMLLPLAPNTTYGARSSSGSATLEYQVLSR